MPPAPAGSKVCSTTLSIADDRSLPADAIVPVDMDAKSRQSLVWLSRPHSHASSTRWPFDASRTRAKRGQARGRMCGGDRAPSAPVLAAVAADARCIAKGQHAALHDAERDTRCARSLTAREVEHAERRWRRHGGYETPQQRQRRRSWGGRHASCGWSEGGLQLLRHIHAAPGRGTGCAPWRACEEASYFGGSMQRHVESPLLHSQNQTLSAASRVEQA